MHRPDELGSMPTGDFSRLQECAERLEEAWKSQGDTTTGVDLARFLPPADDSLRLAVLYELIKTDLSIRMERGQLVGLEYYLEKFPELGPSASLSPHLILEEYLIRKRQGIPAPLSDYKRRYPEQYPRFESLIPREHLPSAASAPPSAPSSPSASPPSAPAPSTPGFAAAPSAPSGTDEVPFFFGLGQGKTIGGHFVLIKRIGGGQFGEVWKALDTQGEIEKALKIILRPMDTEEAKAELQALEIIKRLNHPYLLRTESFWQAGDRLVIVMELAEGSLRDVLKKRRKEGLPGIPVPDLLRYFHNAATALDYLHNKDIVHRDIKPDNILLVEEFAKVADLGLAKLMSQGRSMTASLAGTMAYMAPEVWRERISPRSDQYSMAVAYAELRQGKMPFQGRNLADFFHAHKEMSPELAGIPKQEQEVICKALAKNPHERFLSCLEFMRALDEAVSLAAPVEREAVRRAAVTATQLAAVTGVQEEDRLMTLAPSRPGTEVAPDDEAPLTEKPHDTAPPKLKPPAEPALEAVVKHPPSWQVPTDKPAGWRTAVQAPAATATKQPAVATGQAAAAPRRGRGRLVAVALGLLVAAAALGWFEYAHKQSLEESIRGHVAKGEFEEAFAATDGVLALPFRGGLRESIRHDAVAFAKDTLSKDPSQTVDICQAAAVYFPNDADVRELWSTALETVVLGNKGLVAREQFEAAIRRVEQLPGESAVKTRLTSGIETAWLRTAEVLLAEAKWTPASTSADRLLKAFPQNAQANQLQKLAVAANEAEGLLAGGDHLGALQAVPEGLPASASKKLRGDVKQKWSEHAKRLSDSEQRADVQKALGEWKLFKVHHPNEPDNLTSAQKQFCKLAVRDAGRMGELQDFDAGLELLDQARKIAQDAAEQTAIGNQRRQLATGHRDHLLKQACDQLDKREPKKAQMHLARLADKELDADYGVKDKTVELKTLQGRALAQSGAAGDADKALALFEDVNVKGNDGLDALCLDLLNGAHAKKASAVLIAARDNLSDKAVIDRIIKLNPSLSLVQAAQKDFPTNPAKAADHLRGVEIAALDKATKQTYLQLCENLTSDYVGKEAHYLAPVDFKLFEKAAKESAKLANTLPQAMAKHIERTVDSWPKDESEWKTRLEICRKAESANNPWAKAHLSECILVLGTTDVLPALNDGDTLNYEVYVRALRASKSKKHDEAAQLAAALPVKEPWFIKERREQAAGVLRQAALSRPVGKLFTASDDPGTIYAWFDKALSLSGDSTKNWPDRDRLDFALAAYFKAPPDVPKVETLLKELGEAKDLDPADKDLMRFLSLRSYADAVAYLKNEQPTMTAARLLQDRIEPAIELGEIQLRDKKSAPVNELQALRFAAKAWLLRQTHALSDARKAFDKALALDDQKVDYLLERAECEIADNPNWTNVERDAAKAIQLASNDARPYSLRALAVLNQARKESLTATRVDLLTNALQDADKALAVNPDNAVLPMVLYRASMIALELGNYQYRLDAEGIRESMEWKKHIRDAARHAEKILADFPKEDSALVQMALGNACEDIAYYVEEEVDKRFAQAERAFSRAIQLSADDADRAGYAVSRGRCRYRWANAKSGKAPADTLKNARADIDVALKSRLKPALAAEANYWNGMIIAADDAKGARKAFSAALELADQAPEWGMQALTALFDVDFADGSAFAKTQPDAALDKIGQLRQSLDRLRGIDATQKRHLQARMALVSGEAHESNFGIKKQKSDPSATQDMVKAVETYRSGLPTDLDDINPSVIDVRLHYKWVFTRIDAGPKENLVADADRAVAWSERMRRAGLTDAKVSELKADALWTAALARLAVDAARYREDVVEKIRQCIAMGEGHKDLVLYRARLANELFELMKTTKDSKIVERHRTEALEQLDAAIQLQPSLRAIIEKKADEIRKYTR